ncbi:MAG: TonB-dependent receptor [Bryobacteraceae bacterium]
MRDVSGQPVAGARIKIQGDSEERELTTSAEGSFWLRAIATGHYRVEVITRAVTASLSGGLDLAAGSERTDSLRLSAAGTLTLQNDAQATGGERLSSSQVSALPLNKRDFSQLLLLATGTQTDSNGAANFTQQFTMNGQRGTATVFAMDGADTTDPELGGATFSNFNVDAIEEIKSSSGVLPADIGHGAAGFTEVISKTGTNDLHGSLFEFVRNAAFDARNFFDRRSTAEPGRLPPFARNEFGFTTGGALRRNQTYYFGQYQGFRQVLGTTQVLPVPTADERRGLDTTAFPGDTLTVPVDPTMAPILARYPMPNDPQGPFGARTFAASSKVSTRSDQFSIRIDHKISGKAHLFGRFNLNDVDGPLTNPSQTAIDPAFAVEFFDRQRNATLNLVVTPSAGFTSETSLGYVRSTPNFPAHNRTQSGLTFADGLYEPFNSAAGSLIGAFGNLFQLRQNLAWTRNKHSWQTGIEVRVNRDTTVYGITPNGQYSFGGGAAYSPVAIRSRSGAHDIQPGDLLPDSLTGLLTATPFQLAASVAPPQFPQGDRIGDAAVRREAYNFYFKDTWKATANVTVGYGLRYEYNSRIKEGNHQTSGFYVGADGARFLVNPQPHYGIDKNGWSPRLTIDWKVAEKTIIHAGGAITTLLPNLWQQNFATGGLPFVVVQFATAAPGSPIPFSGAAQSITTPEAYGIDGKLIYPPGKSSRDVPGNTEMDVFRFERDLAALSTDKRVRALQVQGMAPTFRNGYIGTYTAGIEQSVSDVTLNAAYVATAGVKLARMDFPNSYGGADPAHAPYSQFDQTGQIVGGYGPVIMMASSSHSTYHSLQASAAKTSLKYGLGFQASYTFSKSMDDTSAVLGGGPTATSGAIIQSAPQDPKNLRGEKGASTFDVTHVFSFNAVQEVSLRSVPAARALGRRFTDGWQLLGVASITTGPPFTVFSGIQQTGIGSNGGDRPDQVGAPVFSTSRTVREDYFGEDSGNASLFSIPINVNGGTGPNHGRLGTLGRSTFRAPGFHNVDLSVIKNTPIGGPGNPERAVLQIRGEFFNIFNIVNFGLPANIVLGPGFGVISKTSGPSRQIQLSMKILF